jgi:hypothetical protein
MVSLSARRLGATCSHLYLRPSSFLCRICVLCFWLSNCNIDNPPPPIGCYPRIAKAAQAPCPICGQEISDPGFNTHRARRTALKCANCQTKLEWVKPFWDQTCMHWALIGWIPALSREFAPAPGQDPFLRRLYGLPVDAGIALAVFSLLVLLFERIGILGPG